MSTNCSPVNELYHAYLEHESPPDPAVRQYTKELSALLESFPFRQRDEIWRAVNRLNACQEQLAFHAGMRLSAQLLFQLLR